ncbi:MAG: potassium/proton antiporter [Roseiflexaceae bacterium]|nr:potassium/proton antiporter [Roseiflexaceae bacterium]
MLAIEQLLVIIALLLLAAVAASKASSRFGVPSLLLFLGLGMLLGADGPGNVYFDDATLSQQVGTVALAFILFSGGLDTDWKAIRPVLGAGLLLANLGVLISTMLFGALALLVFGLSWLEGLLLGAIISSTDAAAVFSVLRMSNVHLRGNLEPLIELESGSNDPIAVFLTIGLTALLIDPAAPLLGLVPLFFWEMLVGAALGLTFGWLMTWLINRVHLDVEGLYPIISIAAVLLTFGAAVWAHGNGFLAVYVAGITMGNQRLVHRQSLARFHDALAWLMQIVMFLTLGLLVFPSQLVAVIGAGLVGALVLTLGIRPLAVFVALAFTRYSPAEKFMISWAGLRGAVPIVLATYPLIAGVEQASFMFNIVFFIVLASVLFQGTTIRRVADLLKLNTGSPQQNHHSLEFIPAVSDQSRVCDLVVPVGTPAAGMTIRDLGLPRNVLVILIERNGDQIVPSGATVIHEDDHLRVLADPTQLHELNARLLAAHQK